MHMLPTDSRLPHVSIIASVFAVIILVVILWMSYQNVRLGGGDGAGVIPPVPAVASQDDVLDKIIAAPSPPSIVVDAPVVAASSEPVVVDVNPPSAELIPVAAPIVEASVEPSPASAINAPSVVADEPKPEPHVIISVTDDTWMEIRTPEGKVLEAREFRRGENVPINHPVDEFGNAYTITVGNASGVNIKLEGGIIKGLGGKDKVRRNVSLDPKALKPLMLPE